MDKVCKIKEIFHGTQVTEGAGVILNRIFGFNEVNKFDPFLLLDHFKSENRDDFKAGFPFHPHRGIETITYMKKGSVEHQDKLGNKEVLKANQVQWMTAGRGIYHQEMPQTDEGINGFQLWLNMSSSKKMSKAEYRTFTSLPVYEDESFKVTVISGEYSGVESPGKGISGQNPIYFDIEFSNDGEWSNEVEIGANSFIYVYNGKVDIEGSPLAGGSAALLSSGNRIIVKGSEGSSFIFCSGLRLNEPVAWWGPIVMNTDEEIETAKDDLQNGSFG